MPYDAEVSQAHDSGTPINRNESRNRVASAIGLNYARTDSRGVWFYFGPDNYCLPDESVDRILAHLKRAEVSESANASLLHNRHSRNAADLVPELQRRIEQLEAALEKFGIHKSGCPLDRIVDPVPEFDAVANDSLLELCGPGEVPPADTVTEGARLPRKTREELIEEFVTSEGIEGIDYTAQPSSFWKREQVWFQRLADIAGQIAGME